MALEVYNHQLQVILECFHRPRKKLLTPSPPRHPSTPTSPRHSDCLILPESEARLGGQGLLALLSLM